MAPHVERSALMNEKTIEKNAFLNNSITIKTNIFPDLTLKNRLLIFHLISTNVAMNELFISSVALIRLPSFMHALQRQTFTLPLYLLLTLSPFFPFSISLSFSLSLWYFLSHFLPCDSLFLSLLFLTLYITLSLYLCLSVSFSLSLSSYLCFFLTLNLTVSLSLNLSPFSLNLSHSLSPLSVSPHVIVCLCWIREAFN